MTQVEDWKNKYQSLERVRQSEIEDFKYQLETLRTKIVIISFNS